MLIYEVLKIQEQQTIEAAVRGPTKTLPQPTWGSQPTGWEPLGYTIGLPKSAACKVTLMHDKYAVDCTTCGRNILKLNLNCKSEHNSL